MYIGILWSAMLPNMFGAHGTPIFRITRLVVRGHISDVQSEDLPLESTEEPSLLRVARPQKTQPPSVPVILDGWLIGRPTNVSVSLKVSKFRSRSLQPDVLDAFDDDPARVSAWNVWRVEWEAWALHERPLRETLKLFNRFDELAVTTLLQEVRDILREVLMVSGWELAALDAGMRGPAGPAPWRELADEIVRAAAAAQSAENALLRAGVALMTCTSM